MVFIEGVKENDLSVTKLKYGKYDITSKKINNNKRLSDTTK